SGETDTSRFLLAGAVRSIWVRTRQGRLSEAMQEIERKIAGAENVIMESNSIMQFLKPDLYLTVLEPATKDFKVSANEFLEKADAVIIHKTAAAPKWETVSPDRIAGKLTFMIQPPPYVTPEIAEFVRGRLLAQNRIPTQTGQIQAGES
ncbi:MAG: hypothetical protein ACRD4F_16415, partial [Candidatus Angelobacter sp.]